MPLPRKNMFMFFHSIFGLLVVRRHVRTNISAQHLTFDPLVPDWIQRLSLRGALKKKKLLRIGIGDRPTVEP